MSNINLPLTVAASSPASKQHLHKFSGAQMFAGGCACAPTQNVDTHTQKLFCAK